MQIRIKLKTQQQVKKAVYEPDNSLTQVSMTQKETREGGQGDQKGLQDE
jgi:hypothetical protein